MKKIFILLMLTLFVFSVNAQVFITELADPDNDAGARYVELYNAGTSAVDFSTGWQINRYTNGNATPQTPVNLTGTIAAGGFYIIAANGTQFNTVYGFAADQSIGTGGPADSNGDDQIFLLDPSSNIVDFFGVIGEDGSNTCHEFEDGRAERIVGVTTGNGGTWNEANWNVWSDASTASGCTNHISSSPQTAPGDFDPGEWIGAANTNDLTSTVTAPGTQLVAGTMSSVATDSVPVLRFDITDAASGDGLPTNVTGMYFVAGPNNTLDFTQNIDGGGVYDLTNGAVIPVTGQPVVNAGNVYLPVSLSIPDGGTVSFEAYLYIDNANAPDNGILQFQINAASHGFTADGSGSDFETTFAGGDIVGNDFTVQVVATQFTFLTQPSDVDVNQIMSNVVVGVTDAGGNVDVDYPMSYIQVIFSGTGSMLGANGQSTNNGISTYSDLYFDTQQTAVHLTAHDGNGTIGFSDVNSTNFDINSGGGGASCANALSIDVGTHHAIHSATDDYDQWYVYTATTDGRITVENCGSGYSGDTYLEIIEGSCGGSNFDLADDICGSLETLSFNVTAGNDYYIGWGDYNTSTPGEYDWTLSFQQTIPIFNAYSMSNNMLVLQYESPLTSVVPADYTLTATGQTTINFSTASLDPTDHTVVYLTADTDIPANLIRDNINDATNNTSFQFYAGVMPVAYTNTANDPDTVIQGYNLTLRGVVTANDNFNQVWVQDSNNPMSGVLIYSNSVPSMVTVGDTVTFTGQKSIYNGLTEMVNPIIINPIINGGAATASTINAADIEYNKGQDDTTAEPWEGQLVTVSGITIDSLDTSHYEYFGHDCSGNIICFDDDVDYHYGSGFSLTTGSMYDITGVVTYSYSHYKVNPRGTSDATEIVRDLTSVVEDPASQVADATIDATIPVDSLHAIEAFKFKVTDEGTDGLSTKISQFDIYLGPNNTVDFEGDAIAGGWYDFGDAANPIVFSGEPQFTTDHFTFAVDPETAVIDNGTSKEVILHIWLDPAYVVDESVIQLMIKADPHGFVADCMNSQFASTFSADVTGGSLTLDTNVGIEGIDGKSISVYPNPSNGIFNINVSANYNLEVTDITGRVIETKNLTGNTTVEIHNAGVYFFKFSNTGSSYIQKVIVK